jgi:hypothetical protein
MLTKPEQDILRNVQTVATQVFQYLQEQVRVYCSWIPCHYLHSSCNSSTMASSPTTTLSRCLRSSTTCLRHCPGAIRTSTRRHLREAHHRLPRVRAQPEAETSGSSTWWSSTGSRVTRMASTHSCIHVGALSIYANILPLTRNLLLLGLGYTVGDERIDLTTLVVADLDAEEGKAFVREILQSMVSGSVLSMVNQAMRTDRVP